MDGRFIQQLNPLIVPSKRRTPNSTPLTQEFAKEFVKASRQIYRLISQNPQISAVQMADNVGLSTRQVQKYLKRLQESGKITRVGGRKMGEWKNTRGSLIEYDM